MDNNRITKLNSRDEYTFTSVDGKTYYRAGRTSAESLKEFTSKLEPGSLRATEFAVAPTTDPDFIPGLNLLPEFIKAPLVSSISPLYRLHGGAPFWQYHKVGGEVIFDTVFTKEEYKKKEYVAHNEESRFQALNYQRDIKNEKDSLLMHLKMALGLNKESRENISYWSTDPKTAGVYMVTKFHDIFVETNNPQIVKEQNEVYNKIRRGDESDYRGNYIYTNEEIFPAIIKDIQASKGDITVSVAEFNYLADVEQAMSANVTSAFLKDKSARTERLGRDLLKLIDVLGDAAQDKSRVVSIIIGKQSAQTIQLSNLLASKGVRIKKEKEGESQTHQNQFLIEGVNGKREVIWEGSRRANKNRNIEGSMRLTDKEVPNLLQYLKDKETARTNDVTTLFNDRNIFSNIRKPKYSELDSSTKNYYRNEFTFSPIANVFYMPNAIPDSFYSRNRGSRPTPYQDFFYGFTGKRPEGLQAFFLSESDKQLHPSFGFNPTQWRGLGARLNEALGEDLYEKGQGPVSTLLRGFGRLLDYTTGFYSMAQTGAMTQGSYRQAGVKELHRSQGGQEAERGFFETGITTFTNIISSTAGALAFYFGVSHSVSLIRAHMESVGISSILKHSDSSLSGSVRKAQFGYYIPRQHQLLADNIDFIRTTSGLTDSQALQSIFEYSTQQALADLGVKHTSSFDANLAKHIEDILNPPTTSGITSTIVAPTIDPAGSKKKLEDFIRGDKSASKGIQKRLSEFIESTGTNLDDLNESEIVDLVYRAQVTLFGYDKYHTGQLSLGKPLVQDNFDWGIGKDAGGFSYLSRLRKVDKSNYAQGLRPLLERMAVTSDTNERYLFRNALDNFERIVGDAPALLFKQNNQDTALEVTSYGFKRLEDIAKSLDEISKYIPANPLYYSPLLRQAFGINTLNIGVAGEDISLKALIGPGFDTLITTQAAALRNIRDTFKTSFTQNITNSNIILRKNRQLNKLEQQLLSGADVTPDFIEKFSKLKSEFTEEAISNTRSIKMQENLGAYAGTRKLLGSMGAVLIADRLLDRYFMQNEGPNLFTQIGMSINAKAKMNAYEDEEQQLFQQQFTGVIPTTARIPILATGYGIGGSLFYSTSTSSKTTEELDRIMGVRKDQVIPYSNEFIDKKNKIRALLSTRTTTKFSYTGAAIGAIALMGATQVGFNTAAMIANMIADTGRKKGLHPEATSAIASAKITRAVQNTIQLERKRIGAKDDELDIDIINQMSTQKKAAVAIATMQASNIFKSQTEGLRPQYTFATQIPNPIFQLAFVGRLDPKGQVMAWGGGFQFLPLLGAGAIPPFPLSVRIKPTYNTKEDTGIFYHGDASNTYSYAITKSFAEATSAFVFDKDSQFTALLALAAGVNVVRNVGEVVNNTVSSKGIRKAVEASKSYQQYKPIFSLLQTGVSYTERLTRMSQAPVMAAPNSAFKAAMAFFAPIDRDYPRILGAMGPSARKIAPFLTAFAFVTAALSQGSSYEYIGSNIEAKRFKPDSEHKGGPVDPSFAESLIQARLYRAGGVIGTTAIFGVSMAYFGAFRAAKDFSYTGIGAGKDLRKIFDEEIFKRFKGFSREELPSAPLRTESIRRLGTDDKPGPLTSLPQDEQIKDISKLYLDQERDLKKLFRITGRNVYTFDVNVDSALDKNDPEKLLQSIKANWDKIDDYARTGQSILSKQIRDIAAKPLADEQKFKEVARAMTSHSNEFIQLTDRMEPKLIVTAPKRLSVLATAVAVPFVALAVMGTIFSNQGMLEQDAGNGLGNFIQGMYSVPMQIASGASASSRSSQEEIAKIKAYRKLMGIASPENEGQRTSVKDKVLELIKMPISVPAKLFELAGAYKDDPKEFLNLMGSVGTSLGSRGWNYYTQVQSVTTDASMSRFYMQSRLFDTQDQALIESIIKIDPKTAEEVAIAFQGRMARKEAMQLKGRATSSEQQAASGVSKELVMALNVREYMASWLSYQYSSEIARNFQYNMLTSGRVYSEQIGNAPMPNFEYKPWTPYDALMNFRILLDNDLSTEDPLADAAKKRATVDSIIRPLRNMIETGNLEGKRSINFINFNAERRNQVNQGIPLVSGMMDMFAFMSVAFGDDRTASAFVTLPAITATAAITSFIGIASIASGIYAASTSLSALAAYKEGGDTRSVLDSIENYRDSLTNTKYSAFVQGKGDQQKLYYERRRLMYSGSYIMPTPDGVNLRTAAGQINTNLSRINNTYESLLSLSDSDIKTAFDRKSASDITRAIKTKLAYDYSQDIQGKALYEYFALDEESFEGYLNNSKLAGLEAELDDIFKSDIDDSLKSAKARAAIGSSLVSIKSGMTNLLTMDKSITKKVIATKPADDVSPAQVRRYEPIIEDFPSAKSFNEIVSSRGLKRALLDSAGGATQLAFTGIDLSQVYYPTLSMTSQALGETNRSKRYEAARTAGSFTFETIATAFAATLAMGAFKASPLKTALFTGAMIGGVLADRGLNKERLWKSLTKQFRYIDKNIINPVETGIGKAIGGLGDVTTWIGLRPIFGIASSFFKSIDPFFTNIHKSTRGTGWSYLSSLFVPQTLQSRKDSLLRDLIGQETAYGDRQYEISQEESDYRQKAIQASRFERALRIGSRLDYELISPEIIGGTADTQGDINYSLYMDNKGYADRTLTPFSNPNQLSGEMRLAAIRRAQATHYAASSRLRSVGEFHSNTYTNNILYSTGVLMPTAGLNIYKDKSKLFRTVAEEAALFAKSSMQVSGNISELFKRLITRPAKRLFKAGLNRVPPKAAGVIKPAIIALTGFQTYALASDEGNLAQPLAIASTIAAGTATTLAMYPPNISPKADWFKGLLSQGKGFIQNIPWDKISPVLRAGGAYSIIGGASIGAMLDNDSVYNTIFNRDGKSPDKPLRHTLLAYGLAASGSGAVGIGRSLWMSKQVNEALPVAQTANRFLLKPVVGAVFGVFAGRLANIAPNLPFVNMLTYMGTDDTTREDRGKKIELYSMLGGGAIYSLGFALKGYNKSVGQNLTDSMYAIVAAPKKAVKGSMAFGRWANNRIIKPVAKALGPVAKVVLKRRPIRYALGGAIFGLVTEKLYDHFSDKKDSNLPWVQLFTVASALTSFIEPIADRINRGFEIAGKWIKDKLPKSKPIDPDQLKFPKFNKWLTAIKSKASTIWQSNLFQSTSSRAIGANLLPVGINAALTASSVIQVGKLDKQDSYGQYKAATEDLVNTAINVGPGMLMTNAGLPAIPALLALQSSGTDYYSMLLAKQLQDSKDDNLKKGVTLGVAGLTAAASIAQIAATRQALRDPTSLGNATLATGWVVGAQVAALANVEVSTLMMRDREMTSISRSRSYLAKQTDSRKQTASYVRSVNAGRYGSGLGAVSLIATSFISTRPTDSTLLGYSGLLQNRHYKELSAWRQWGGIAGGLAGAVSAARITPGGPLLKLAAIAGGFALGSILGSDAFTDIYVGSNTKDKEKKKESFARLFGSAMTTIALQVGLPWLLKNGLAITKTLLNKNATTRWGVGGTKWSSTTPDTQNIVNTVAAQKGVSNIPTATTMPSSGSSPTPYVDSKGNILGAYKADDKPEIQFKKGIDTSTAYVVAHHELAHHVNQGLRTADMTAEQAYTKFGVKKALQSLKEKDRGLVVKQALDAVGKKYEGVKDIDSNIFAIDFFDELTAGVSSQRASRQLERAGGRVRPDTLSSWLRRNVLFVESKEDKDAKYKAPTSEYTIETILNGSSNKALLDTEGITAEGLLSGEIKWKQNIEVDKDEVVVEKKGVASEPSVKPTVVVTSPEARLGVDIDDPSFSTTPTISRVPTPTAVPPSSPIEPTPAPTTRVTASEDLTVEPPKPEPTIPATPRVTSPPVVADPIESTEVTVEEPQVNKTSSSEPRIAGLLPPAVDRMQSPVTVEEPQAINQRRLQAQRRLAEARVLDSSGATITTPYKGPTSINLSSYDSSTPDNILNRVPSGLDQAIITSALEPVVNRIEVIEGELLESERLPTPITQPVSGNILDAEVVQPLLPPARPTRLELARQRLDLELIDRSLIPQLNKPTIITPATAVAPNIQRRQYIELPQLQPAPEVFRPTRTATIPTERVIPIESNNNVQPIAEADVAVPIKSRTASIAKSSIKAGVKAGLADIGIQATRKGTRFDFSQFKAGQLGKINLITTGADALTSIIEGSVKGDSWGQTASKVGWDIAKGLVAGAAIQGVATGISTALAGTTAAAVFGSVVMPLVAVGLLAYGVYDVSNRLSKAYREYKEKNKLSDKDVRDDVVSNITNSKSLAFIFSHTRQGVSHSHMNRLKKQNRYISNSYEARRQVISHNKRYSDNLRFVTSSDLSRGQGTYDYQNREIFAATQIINNPYTLTATVRHELVHAEQGEAVNDYQEDRIDYKRYKQKSNINKYLKRIDPSQVEYLRYKTPRSVDVFGSWVVNLSIDQMLNAAIENGFSQDSIQVKTLEKAKQQHWTKTYRQMMTDKKSLLYRAPEKYKKQIRKFIIGSALTEMSAYSETIRSERRMRSMRGLDPISWGLEMFNSFAHQIGIYTARYDPTMKAIDHSLQVEGGDTFDSLVNESLHGGAKDYATTRAERLKRYRANPVMAKRQQSARLTRAFNVDHRLKGAAAASAYAKGSFKFFKPGKADAVTAGISAVEGLYVDNKSFGEVAAETVAGVVVGGLIAIGLTAATLSATPAIATAATITTIGLGALAIGGIVKSTGRILYKGITDLFKSKDNPISSIPLIGDIFFPKAAAADEPNHFVINKKQQQLKDLKGRYKVNSNKSNQFDKEYQAYVRRVESGDGNFITQFLDGVGKTLEAARKGIVDTVKGITQGAVDAFNWIKSGGLADLLSQNLGVFSGSVITGESGSYVPKVSAEFVKKSQQVASNIGMPHEYLMAVMGFETGGTFNPAERNKAGSGATGLIQFMPATARNMFGLSTQQLATMSAVEQLNYVEKYYKKVLNGRKITSLADAYMVVLYPAALGKGDNYALFKSGTRAYSQNRGLDVNKDGIVTAGEATANVRAYLPGASSTQTNDSIIYKVTGGRQLTKADISSGYGMRFHPIRRVHRLHAGVDISSFDGKSINGANISYTKGGVVTKVGFIKGYGNSVEIRHPDGTYSFSAHLLTLPPLKVGQTIEAGQIIGQVGSTGDSTGPHLHWEKRDKNYKLVDPTDSIGMVVLSRGKVQIQGQSESQLTPQSASTPNTQSPVKDSSHPGLKELRNAKSSNEVERIFKKYPDLRPLVQDMRRNPSQYQSQGSTTSELPSSGNIQAGNAVFTTMRTGPRGFIGKGSANHVDFKLKRGVSFDWAIKVFDAKAQAHAARGERIQITNNGAIYNAAWSNQKKKEWLQQGFNKHWRQDKNYWSVDYYITKPGETTGGVEQSGPARQIAVPQLSNTTVKFNKGGNYGLHYLIIDNATGQVIMKEGHGDERAPMPTNIKVPGKDPKWIPLVKDEKHSDASSAQQTAENEQQLISSSQIISEVEKTIKIEKQNSQQASADAVAYAKATLPSDYKELIEEWHLVLDSTIEKAPKPKLKAKEINLEYPVAAFSEYRQADKGQQQVNPANKASASIQKNPLTQTNQLVIALEISEADAQYNKVNPYGFSEYNTRNMTGDNQNLEGTSMYDLTPKGTQGQSA